MPIDKARRILALGDAANVTDEARHRAEDICDYADTKRAIATLKQVAKKRGVTIEELIAAYND